MFLGQPNTTSLRKILVACESSIFSVLNKCKPPYSYTQHHSYVDVYMKRKKDPYYDSIESIHNSIGLKPLISLKNIIAASPDYCMPISTVSKRGLEFGISIRVARFMRQYPSVFEEFVGPKYNLPWFRLTQKAIELDREENDVYRKCKADIELRLKKLILMSGENKLPIKIIQGMEWYLGLPDGYLGDPEKNLDGSFRIVEMEEGLKGLSVKSDEKFLSVIQRNALKRGEYSGEAIAFPLFPSKGLRLRRKISDWLDEFQRLPYVSPYEDYSDLEPDSDVSEKRVVGVLHELLSLFVEHAAERKKLLCLRKHLGLPQKVHKAFERHPHMFYLSLRNKTCTTILKEAYLDSTAIQPHPLASVRGKYINLVKESEIILKKRRLNGRCFDRKNVKVKDSDPIDDDRSELEV